MTSQRSVSFHALRSEAEYVFRARGHVHLSDLRPARSSIIRHFLTFYKFFTYQRNQPLVIAVPILFLNLSMLTAF